MAGRRLPGMSDLMVGTPLAGDKPPRYIPRTSPLDSGLRRSDEMGWPE